MSGLCKDCKHWQSFEEWWEEDGRFRYDTLEDVDSYGETSMKLRYGTCKMAESNGEKPEVEGTLAFAVDGENFSASLVASPNYGCIQWEAKDESSGRRDRG